MDPNIKYNYDQKYIMLVQYSNQNITLYVN